MKATRAMRSLFLTVTTCCLALTSAVTHTPVQAAGCGACSTQSCNDCCNDCCDPCCDTCCQPSCDPCCDNSCNDCCNNNCCCFSWVDGVVVVAGAAAGAIAGAIAGSSNKRKGNQGPQGTTGGPGATGGPGPDGNPHAYPLCTETVEVRLTGLLTALAPTPTTFIGVLTAPNGDTTQTANIVAGGLADDIGPVLVPVSALQGSYTVTLLNVGANPLDTTAADVLVEVIVGGSTVMSHQLATLPTNTAQAAAPTAPQNQVSFDFICDTGATP